VCWSPVPKALPACQPVLGQLLASGATGLRMHDLRAASNKNS
jgi:hypothetical protein